MDKKVKIKLKVIKILYLINDYYTLLFINTAKIRIETNHKNRVE